MAALAAVCGVLIMLYGYLTTRRVPSDAQLAIEVTSFVGGLVLCFLAVVLARLGRLARALDARQPPDAHRAPAAAETDVLAGDEG